MELIILILLVLIITILMKLSNIQNRLEEIQQSLKQSCREPIKPIVSKVVQPVVTKPKVIEPKVTIKSIVTKKEPPKPRVVEPRSPEPSFIDNLKERFGDTSLEEILFGNIILKIAIVAFILGIGLFLKYSIDKDWIPIWGRVLIGIVVGMAMLVGGIKMIDNRHKLFSEGLFGGGIAVLYLSIFAGFALEGFKFIDLKTTEKKLC
ncbi:DUF2339 domain-containing protein [Sulfurovum sp. bin170]|uniref:DUF2339 domain-containing protein n=1 Tax=Sulfurovum sp. bin170 TaxID=2695268 RepID=UPI0013DF92EF|nr:DUF2339 domain-containing protein [Sulfurovum sp. bin170]NEW60874.1 DUF2339 domain-containing protein [Sulfurovum sp. bin170]